MFRKFSNEYSLNSIPALSSYGSSQANYSPLAQMRGCEEMHIECPDKTHSVVTHCDCNPRYPDLQHRHIFEYSDLLDPPIQIRPQEYQPSSGFLDIDSIRRLLILARPHYPSVWARRTRSSPTVEDGSDASSVSSFEIQIRTTTPEETIVACSLLKIRRESQDARELLIQVCSLWDILFQSFYIHLAEWEACLVELPIWRPSRG
jgi:hypothetical protein